jgi:hypothetical protein
MPATVQPPSRRLQRPGRPPLLATTLLSGLGCGSRYQAASSGSLVLRTAKAENRKENDSQKGEAKAETGAFTEALGQIDAENDADNEIYERDKHQNDPPGGPADDLAPNVNVVDRDDAGPAGLASFGKHLPHRRDQHHRNEQSDDHRERAGRSAFSAVLDLAEQACGREQDGLRNLDE